MKQIHEMLEIINEHIVPRLAERLGEDDRDVQRLQNALGLLTDEVHEHEVALCMTPEADPMEQELYS